MAKNKLHTALLCAALLCALCAAFSSCKDELTRSEQTQTSQQTSGDIQTDEVADAVIPAGIHNPVFSVEGGIYDGEISLELSAPDGISGVSVRYTMSGEEPVAKSGAYEQPLTINSDRSSTVVRAACFDAKGNMLGNIVTNTYIRSDAAASTAYTVSITAKKEYLEGSSGIMSNPTQRGSDWERPAHVEIFTQSGERVISSDAGLRIFGGSSRSLAQKSFRIIARSSEKLADSRYSGTGSFKYPFFENRIVNGAALERYDRFILRNGGNDSMQSTAADPLQMNLLRDNIADNFAAICAPNVGTQMSEMVSVYLNGEYYGLLDMKEDINDDYVSNVWGFDAKDKVTVIKSELDTSRHCAEHDNGGACRFDNVWFYYEVDDGDPAELDLFTGLCKKAINSSDADYENVYNEVAQKLDLRNFLEYSAYNLYVCNTDWPHNNIRLWRYTGDAVGTGDAIGTGDAVDGVAVSDGRWRFTLRDMDFAFGRYQNLVLPEIYTMADTDTFYRALANYWDGASTDGIYPDSLYLQGLLDFCLKNDSFRSDFIEYCRYLASKECTEQLSGVMSDAAASVRADIGEHIERWSDTIDGDYTAANWDKQVDAMLEWADERPAHFLAYLDKAMSHYE